MKNEDKKERGEKMTVAQGGTRTRDLVNGLSYRVSGALQNLSQGHLFFYFGEGDKFERSESSKVHQLAL